MKVIITDTAQDDLLSIGRRIAESNLPRALSFMDEVESKCLKLADMPRAFPLLPNWEHTGIRRRVHGDYLIFYRINKTEIEILHILHGARDFEAVLFPEEP